MNFIASVLIDVMDDEQSAFLLFIYLLDELEMKMLFVPVRLSVNINRGFLI